jgi:hypothetical protein
MKRYLAYLGIVLAVVIVGLFFAQPAKAGEVICTDLGGGVVKCREVNTPRPPPPIICTDLGNGVVKCRTGSTH